MARIKTKTKGVFHDDVRNKYIVAFDYPPDSSGKRNRKHKTYNTYEEAKRANIQFESNKINGETVNPKGITLRVWLAEWMVGLKVADKAVTTIQGYENIIAHINPVLGDKKLMDLNPNGVGFEIGHSIKSIKKNNVSAMKKWVSKKKNRKSYMIVKKRINYSVYRVVQTDLAIRLR